MKKNGYLENLLVLENSTSPAYPIHIHGQSELDYVSFLSFGTLTGILRYTAIFLTNGLCIVYHSIVQCLTLVYPGWDRNLSFLAS